MDNNNKFVPNNDNDLDCLFFDALLKLEPKDFFLSSEEFNDALSTRQQQNGPFRVEHSNFPLLDSIISQDQFIYSEELDALSQQQQQRQNQHFGVEQDNFSFPDPIISQDQFISREELDALSQQQQQQQNQHFGVEHDNDVPLPDPIMIQEQFLEGNTNNFLTGEGVSDNKVVDVEGPSRRAGKEPMPQSQDQFFMHDNDNFFNGGEGVPNVEPDPFPQQNQTQPANDEDVRPLSPWPPPPELFSCSCCEVLRQINYTNGVMFDKLEIHGAVGVINHAICHVKDRTPNRPPTDSYRMIDFCNKNTEEIRSFLKVHCKSRIDSGFIPMEDHSMSAFYDAVCTGMDWTEVSNDEEDDDLGPPNGTELDPDPEPELENERTSTCRRKRRRNMSVQRQRIPRMTLRDLSGVFHMTIKDAANELDVCDSTVKGICRRGKLKRWPQRRIQSLAKKMKIIKRGLVSEDPGVVRRTQDEIRRLQQQIIESCGGITPTGIQIL